MKLNKQQLETMENTELEEAIRLAYQIIERRKETRKKELWGNVAAALRKYESEFGDITTDDGDRDGVICTDRLDEPGFLCIAN